ncbi:ferredoxin [Deinobacterium chartae]|uniref:Ferredoxin n=1 Tax=Deinobacterium chartae TaxID=521158 RepID=A0A841I0F3_9DEIO|nr:2Fe-2S iron-sulfur cluster-binding protein [Deinobacterium chartae]MBB6098673.1 ferredoxin [Deinobacterium chartae]
MPTLHVTDYGSFEVPEGKRLVLALEGAGVPILHRCGGKARCTTCRVVFEAGEPDRMTEAERAVLEAKGLLGQARLSCQMTCQDGMRLAPVMTERNTELTAGTAPAETIEPEPVWISVPR